ncbi:hypothetical protein [Rhodopseudomonas sp. B29]|uniref:hypothetical protein n=1 Tax=Rhodopseudomonas sp. B29 TaxID=95607 RepID=UPI0011D19816|nr:hypothetical protein [Rhodopseudomonas sp. B29]
MTTVDEASSLLRELASPRRPGEYVKQAIERAAVAAGIEYWRAFDLWYAKARRVEEYEIDQITDAKRRKEDAEARSELRDLRLRLLRLEARMSASDADFHRPEIDAAREQMRGLGGVDRPVASAGKVKR